MRGLISLAVFLTICISAQAVGLNRFPFRPFDDVTRPKNADEVRISYAMLVGPRDGVDKVEAKIIALYEMVQRHVDVGYDLSKPKITDAGGGQWQVRVPSYFSINQKKQPPDFLVCVDKKNGKISCFGPPQK